MFASTTNSWKYCDFNGNNCFNPNGDGPVASNDTLIPNWPDVLTCRLSDGSVAIMYADYMPHSSGAYTYRTPGSGNTYVEAQFNSDQSWRSGSASDCTGLSIEDLTIFGNAYSLGASRMTLSGREGQCYIKVSASSPGGSNSFNRWVTGIEGQTYALGMYYYGDADDHNSETNPSSLNFTELVLNERWGSSWTDSSEMAEVGYFNAADYAANKTAIDSYNSRGYIVTAPFVIQSRESLAISNKGISEVSANSIRMTFEVVGCF